MKSVESLAFNLVRVLMTLAIMSSQAEQLCCVRYPVGKNDRKVQWIETALTKNQPKFGTVGSYYVKFAFLMAAFGPQVQPIQKIVR